MTIKDTIAALIVITLSVAMGVALAQGVASTFPSPQHSFGSNSDNYLATNPTVSKVFINSADTLLVGTSTGRTYLVINNISGATTTAQVISCNFGDRAATLYTGFSITATTSVTLALDNLYRGAIHCIAPANGALISVTDF